MCVKFQYIFLTIQFLIMIRLPGCIMVSGTSVLHPTLKSRGWWKIWKFSLKNLEKEHFAKKWPKTSAAAFGRLLSITTPPLLKNLENMFEKFGKLSKKSLVEADDQSSRLWKVGKFLKEIGKYVQIIRYSRNILKRIEIIWKIKQLNLTISENCVWA